MSRVILVFGRALNSAPVPHFDGLRPILTVNFQSEGSTLGVGPAVRTGNSPREMLTRRYPIGLVAAWTAACETSGDHSETPCLSRQTCEPDSVQNSVKIFARTTAERANPLKIRIPDSLLA